MANMHYDIFISYRRDKGLDVARPLKLELEKHGFRVFLDFDDINDGIFSDKIKNAIEEAPVFIIILSENALANCLNDNDWVRQEIEYAIKLNRHIISINPNLSFNGIPDDLPDDFKERLGLHHYFDLMTGQLFEYSVRKIISERN